MERCEVFIDIAGLRREILYAETGSIKNIGAKLLTGAVPLKYGVWALLKNENYSKADKIFPL